MQKLKILTQTALPHFREYGLKINYKKGQLFVRPEDTAQGIYYLASGQALLFASKGDGVEQIIGIWEEGAIFGKVGSVIPQRHLTTYTQALSDCLVYRLDCNQFQSLLQNEPAFVSAYMQQVSFNNIFILSQSLTLGERNIYSRIISQLLMLSDFYGSIKGNSCKLRVVLTQEQLAAMLCITREYLSKTLKKIKLKKLIMVDKNGNITIPSLANLKKELEMA